jgi:hypothetical protein
VSLCCFLLHVSSRASFELGFLLILDSGVDIAVLLSNCSLSFDQPSAFVFGGTL